MIDGITSMIKIEEYLAGGGDADGAKKMAAELKVAA